MSRQNVEVIMLKKIRCIYWSMRDRGKGKQAIAVGVVLLFTVALLLSAVIKGIVGNKSTEEVPSEIGVSGSAISGTSIATEGAISGEEPVDEEVQEVTDQNVPLKSEVDTSGLDPFHGFMSESTYERMESLVVQECKARNCNAVKKLDYQQTKEETYDVASFLLLADGSVFQCNYNLKSDVVSVAPTNYKEADIQTLHETEIKKEQENIRKQQEKDRKKQKAAKKKKSKKKKNKKKSTKKSSKKSVKKSKGRKKR